ncbi:MAG: SIMPL domain-containing protein [Candidatus Paceibacterota bacterium]
MNEINLNSPGKEPAVKKVPEKKENNQNDIFKLSFIILLILICILLFLNINKQNNTITMARNVSSNIAFDRAEIRFGFESVFSSASEALFENERRVNNFINYLQGEGVLLENIKVLNDVKEPQYQKIGNVVSVSFYKVKKDVLVKVDLEKIERIIEIALSMKADEIGAINFGKEDIEEELLFLKKEAITLAEKDAENIAKEMNVKLGNVLNYSDNYILNKENNELLVNVNITYLVK